MRKLCVFAILMVGLLVANQALAGLKDAVKTPVAVSGTGAAITTDFIGSDEVVVTVNPENVSEVAHYGFRLGWNPAEYEFIGVRNTSVFSVEDGRASVASSYIFSGSDVKDMGIVLRKTGLIWGQLEPQEGLRMVTRNGEWRIYEPAPAFTPNPAAAPQELALFQNYPNPFNPSTEIRFSVAGDGPAELAIYNALGQKVRTLINESLMAGEHAVRWNADDDTGEPVSPGMYFYKLNADGQTAVRKMLLLK